ncbi:MAG: YraN family protein [Candidatus Ancillula sp.]|jgi:putative endonuclease|nr:YraN family protein [Candidatus Ancillula sp.]
MNIMQYDEISGYATKKFGAWAEEYAAHYLERAEYKIVERNWRYSNVGEVDIIAQSGNELIFVEVKARRTLKQGTSLEAVDRRKLTQVRKVASAYLQDLPYRAPKIRIDVIGIYMHERKIELKHLQGVKMWT